MSKMMSEQDRLAQLVKDQDLEPVDTASLLEDSLKEAFGAPSAKVIEHVKNEIGASGDVVENSPIRRYGGKKVGGAVPLGYSTEQMLLNLYNLRDDLIIAFESTGLNTITSEKITNSIRRAESCIKTAGGDVEDFVPMNHLSGLKAPNLYKNAEKVIETTVQCYTLGKIEDAKIKDGGRSIAIVFSGSHNGTLYKVNGTINTEEWTGNEAIDYIYTPNEGKMSIKAYENGRWVDKSASNKYQVFWELEEKSSDTQNKQIENKDQKSSLAKEGEAGNKQNKIEVTNMEEEIGELIKG